MTLMNRRAAITVFSLAAGVVASRAADLRPPSPRVSKPKDAYSATLAHLNRYAVLLMIRATFDVLEVSMIGNELGAKLRQLGAVGPTDRDEEELDANLLAEGSYYLISLKYTVLVGGAIWPSDRSESVYVRDTLVVIDQLERELIEAVDARDDPLPILVRAQKVRATTEGQLTVPAEEDHFMGRDSLVSNAMSSDGAWANT